MCEHNWKPIEKSVLYNKNGEYVEGYGWGPVFISSVSTAELRCEKCKSLKKENIIYPPLPRPKIWI